MSKKIEKVEGSKAENLRAEQKTGKNQVKTPEKGQKDNQPTSLKAEILSWVEVFVVAIALAWFLTSFIIVNATVPSGSMQDTIQPGDRLMGLRLTYTLFSQPKRGDIAVFRYPVDAALGKKTNYIKRVIGLPGETIDIKKGKIYINGSDPPLAEPDRKDDWTVENDGFHFEIPEGCYLMLGDNRNKSSDARYWKRLAL
ncbi:MAG: signal peptidase I, partial [Lentisphaeria bacterium]|nr:signal peptidase I [Lentisphaeria bacterium]